MVDDSRIFKWRIRVNARPLQVSQRYFAVALVFCSFVAGCSDADRFINEQLSRLIAKSKGPTIDLSGIGPRAWERLCFIGPHTTNGTTKQVLGFDWDSERKSSIASDEKILLLIFTSGQRVLAFAEYPRSLGDFVRSAGSCVSSTDARFRKEIDGNGSIALVHVPGH